MHLCPPVLFLTTMKRRACLSGIALGISGLTGCMATGQHQTDVSDRKLSDVSATGPEGSAISIESDVKQRRINPERTAQFELTVTWNGSELQGLAFGNEIPFSFPNYSTGRSGLVLLPANTSLERQNEQTWVPETYSNGDIESNSSLVLGKLEPGESLSGSWAVWADPKSASRVAPGTYKFENRIGLYEDLSSDDGENFDWSLFLEITET